MTNPRRERLKLALAGARQALWPPTTLGMEIYSLGQV